MKVIIGSKNAIVFAPQVYRPMGMLRVVKRLENDPNAKKVYVNRMATSDGLTVVYRNIGSDSAICKAVAKTAGKI